MVVEIIKGDIMSNRVLDKFKSFWGFEEEDEEDLVEEKVDKEQVQQSYTPPSLPSYTGASKNRVVNIHANNQIKIDVFQPKAFEESLDIVDCLRSKRPVIVNLEAIQPELARKIFDFLSGALCAIDGKAEKISKGIILMAPSNVEINGKITSDDLMTNSDDFPDVTMFKFK
jgi:cell division inhibitor SepF